MKSKMEMESVLESTRIHEKKRFLKSPRKVSKKNVSGGSSATIRIIMFHWKRGIRKKVRKGKTVSSGPWNDDRVGRREMK